jgi:hypothetical protein
MNPKKKSRRYRVSVSIHALDLAISRFTHSLGYRVRQHSNKEIAKSKSLAGCAQT